MELDVVGSELADRGEERRDSLTERWGELPYRVRDPIRVTEHDFPETPDDIFPWVADDGRILLVRDSGHSFSWEPPGGKGESGETVAETAERETRDETGIECEVANLLFTETLQFDYGESVLAPVLHAGFLTRRVDGRARTGKKKIEEAAWFSMDELPKETQFTEDIRSLAPRG